MMNMSHKSRFGQHTRSHRKTSNIRLQSNGLKLKRLNDLSFPLNVTICSSTNLINEGLFIINDIHWSTAVATTIRMGCHIRLFGHFRSSFSQFTKYSCECMSLGVRQKQAVTKLAVNLISLASTSMPFSPFIFF